MPGLQLVVVVVVVVAVGQSVRQVTCCVLFHGHVSFAL